MQGQQELHRTTCEHCLKSIQSQKIDLHFSYCIKFFIQCPTCLKFYDKHYEDEHLEENHKKQICTHCRKQFQPSQIQSHKKQCAPRFLLCIYCEQKVPELAYQNHQNTCGTRTKPCQICGQNIQMKNSIAHEQLCLQRLCEEPMKSNQRGQPIGNKRVKTQSKKTTSSVAVNLYRNTTAVSRRQRKYQKVENEQPMPTHRAEKQKSRQSKIQQKIRKECEQKREKRTIESLLQNKGKSRNTQKVEQIDHSIKIKEVIELDDSKIDEEDEANKSTNENGKEQSDNSKNRSGEQQ